MQAGYVLPFRSAAARQTELAVATALRAVSSEKTPSAFSSACNDTFSVAAMRTGSQDDRESGWADNNTASPFYWRMYVSWNDFTVGGGALFVRYSTDNGLTWTNARQLTSGFIRNVQITGDLVTGDVYIAGLNEGGGGFAPRSNLMFRSTDGGATWTNTYTGPTFFGPGRNVTGYFVYMYSSPSPAWVYTGWGQPAAINHVVH